MCRVANQQTRLPRATSSLALNASRAGASTASLGNLFQCVTTLCVKNFLLISNLNLPCPSLKLFPLVLSLSTLIFFFLIRISLLFYKQDKSTLHSMCMLILYTKLNIRDVCISPELQCLLIQSTHCHQQTGCQVPSSNLFIELPQ